MDKVMDQKQIDATCEKIRNDNKDAFSAKSLHIYAGGGHKEGDNVAGKEAYASFGRKRAMLEFETKDETPTRSFFENNLGAVYRGFYHDCQNSKRFFISNLGGGMQ